MNIITGNILDVKKGILAHQVNCKGVMGAGLALQIRKKYPEVYLKYKDFCDAGHASLGVVQQVRAIDGLYIANIFGQDGFGRNGVYTDYSALGYGLEKLGRYYDDIHIPYGIGCGLANGDWNVVSKLIDKYAPNSTVWRLPLA